MYGTMYIAVGKIRIQKLCLNCISDPNACRITAGIVGCCTVSAVVCAWWRQGGVFFRTQKRI